jgi:nucleoside-diphosphate-sugar epimerase
MSNVRFRQTREELLNILATDINSILAEHPLPDFNDKCVFITGATGFMGRWLLLAIKCLNDSGSNIQLIALSRNPDRFLDKAPEWKNTPWLSWISGDIRDFTYPSQAIDAIIHGATDTAPQFATQHPEQLYESMVQGTERIFQLASKRKATRVLLISSGAVYGEQPDELSRLSETFPAKNLSEQDPYGEGKRAMEQIGMRFAIEHGQQTVIARCFTFIGCGLAKHLAISQFIQNAQENPCIEVKGDGKTVRSYLYAADMALWLLTILARGKPGEVYNVGSSEAVTLIETATQVSKRLAPDKPVIILNAEATSPRRRYVPDTHRAESELGLRVWTSLDKALQTTAATTLRDLQSEQMRELK